MILKKEDLDMPQMNKTESVLQAIKQHRIIIIYRGLTPRECLEVSSVLYDAGIRLFEVTMNSHNTEDSIKLLHSELESDTYVGAGTVLDTEQVESSFNAGASYIISPNVNVSVINRTKELGMISIPGAMTPTEVDLAVKSGGDIIKVFPINVLGPEYITQLRGPLDNVEFLPCGGLNLELVKQLSNTGYSALGIGVQLLGKDLLEKKDWKVLRSRAEELIQASSL